MQNIPYESYCSYFYGETKPEPAAGSCLQEVSAPPHHYDMWADQLHPAYDAPWSADAHPACMADSPTGAHAYAIARRNERERNRVRHINSTFEHLRKHLPQVGGVARKRKLSKAETLRTAIRYIEHLTRLLQDGADDSLLGDGGGDACRCLRTSRKLERILSAPSLAGSEGRRRGGLVYSPTSPSSSFFTQPSPTASPRGSDTSDTDTARHCSQ